MTLGLVCDACDTLSVLGATTCAGCGAPLGIVPARAPRGGTPAAARAVMVAAGSSLPVTAPTPLITSRKCTACGAAIPGQQKFCGECGTRVDASGPTAVAAAGSGRASTQFFGAMQAPGRAKLILIKGEGMDGVSYHLAGGDHIAGRLEGAILFPEDPLLSPRHANFFYRDGKLHVRDEHSHNGVFIRIKAPVILQNGSTFLVGEQLLRVEACPPDAVPQPDADGTYFYGSPKRPAKACLVQLLTGGDVGIVFRGRTETITIGREGNDVNFPNDPFISGRHAAVAALDGGRFQLADVGSRNGTFLRVTEEAPLFHGDYVFLGQQLLRVEIT